MLELTRRVDENRRGRVAQRVVRREWAGGAILDLVGPTSAKLGDEKQHGGADRGVDDRAGSSGAEMDTKLRNQSVASKGAKNTDHYVTNPTARSTNTETFDR